MTTKYDGEELNQIVSTLKRIDKFVVCAGTVKTMDMHQGHLVEVSNLDGTPVFGINDKRYKIDLRAFPKLEKGEYSIDLIGEGSDSFLYISNNNHDLFYNIPLIFSKWGEYPLPNVDYDRRKRDSSVSISIQAKDLQKAVESLDAVKDTPEHIVFESKNFSDVALSTSHHLYKQCKKVPVISKTIGKLPEGVEYMRVTYPFDKFKKIAKSAEGTVHIYLGCFNCPVLCQWSAKNHKCSAVLFPAIVNEGEI